MTTVDAGRERVFASAVEVLGEQGFAGLTVRAVAQAAGCSTTGIYTYFGSKQGLLDALYVHGFAAFELYVAQSGGTGAGALERRMLRYREWALAEPALYLLMFASRAGGYVPGESAGLTGLASLASLEAAVEAAGVPGTEHRSQRMIARELWAATHGVVMLEIAGPGHTLGDPAATISSLVTAVISS